MTTAEGTYFRWQASAATPPVALACHVMHQLERAILAVFRPRGPEVTGILLGHRDADSGEFVIEGFEPLKGTNVATWREQVTDYRLGEMRFIGIYRSQMHPGLAVSADDCDLVEKLLPREEGVLLLIKPLSANECVGAFFLCDGGAVVDEAAGQREFPFGSGAVTSVPAKAHPKWLRVLLPLTAIAAGIALAMLIRSQRESGPGENPVSPISDNSAVNIADTPIELRALPADNNMVRVLWNADSPSVGKASSALLTVSDGERTASWQLGRVELRKGSLLWKRAGRNVTVRMSLSRPNAASLTEFARVTDGPPINSSSASPVTEPAPKPSPLTTASAATGEQESLTATEMEPRSEPVRRRHQPPRAPVSQEVRVQQPGRVKRIFGGLASKATHLWPFHSAKQD